jgi:hypothetical protein
VDRRGDPSRGDRAGIVERLSGGRFALRSIDAERVIGLLTLALLFAGVLLIAAEFLDLFQVKIGASVIDEQSGGEHHSYALLLIGAVICGAGMAARSSEAWAPAAGAAALGGMVLLIAFIGDLPDATRTDLVRGARIASADPAAGFWVELIGASLALVSGAALAYLLGRRETGSDHQR